MCMAYCRTMCWDSKVLQFRIRIMKWIQKNCNVFLSFLAKGVWNGLVLCTHSSGDSYLSIVTRSTGWPMMYRLKEESQRGVMKSWVVGGVGGGKQERKTIRTGRQWYTVNRLEGLWVVHFSCHQILWRCNLPRCDSIDHPIARRLLLPLPETKIQSEHWSWMPSGTAEACRSVWNTMVPHQLQVSNFYGTKIGLLLSTPL